jgi:hypothetical protein
MPDIVLTGRVLPETVQISVGGLPAVNWKIPEADLEISLQLEIQGSKITVRCNASRFDPPKDVVPIWLRSFDLARMTVDLLGFSEGRALTVVLDSITDDAGKTTPIEAKVPALARYVTSVTDSTYGDVWELIVKEPAIFLGLNDLVTTIALPHHGPVNAARVVEGLTHLVAGDAAKPSERWQALREALNLDRDFLQPISDISTEPRHGNRTHIPGHLVDQVVTRAWMIMNRFLEYKLKGCVPLPLTEFPLLTGKKP